MRRAVIVATESQAVDCGRTVRITMVAVRADSASRCTMRTSVGNCTNVRRAQDELKAEQCLRPG